MNQKSIKTTMAISSFPDMNLFNANITTTSSTTTTTTTITTTDIE